VHEQALLLGFDAQQHDQVRDIGRDVDVGRPVDRLARWRDRVHELVPKETCTAHKVIPISKLGSRLFLVKSALYGVPFEALHIFTGPAATMQVKVASLVTVVDAGQLFAGSSASCRWLLALMGHVQASGSARLRGRELLGMKPFHIARLGLGYVPEARDIFPRLTVRENLMLGIKGGALKPRWQADDFYRLFPILEERADEPAGVMSGGEQQMLTLARTLMGDPELVMIDEPTEGLAPRVVDQVAELLAEITRRGVAILLVEQKLDIALRISRRVVVMGHGRIVHQSSPQELLANEAVCQEWLGV